MSENRPHVLPTHADVPREILESIRRDHDRFAGEGLPANLDQYLRETYGLDMTASYAGFRLKNPWGKASGQLSLNRAQIEEAAAAQLGLVVLKTVIAQDAQGLQTMSAWAIKESRMVVEPIESPTSGATGWTVAWKGRGWWQSFEDYLTLIGEACAIGRNHDLLIVPSVKYHLPAPGETVWREDEYAQTTRAIIQIYESTSGQKAMPLEKDFSPTLAGSSLAVQHKQVIEWLDRVPGLIRSASSRPGQVKVGLKLFNTLGEDPFQLAMLAHVHKTAARPDYITYANRLFDPALTFEGKKGIAYGGPDLSDRNLRTLSAWRRTQQKDAADAGPLEISATGDISSGRIAVEYALRGCTSFQIHTLFQLPADQYALRIGSKVQKAIHRLYFDPQDGFIVWAFHAARRLGLVGDGGIIRFLDLAVCGARSALTRGDLDSQPL
jgi:dihydroorotate dehydrogenase